MSPINTPPEHEEEAQRAMRASVLQAIERNRSGADHARLSEWAARHKRAVANHAAGKPASEDVVRVADPAESPRSVHDLGRTPDELRTPRTNNEETSNAH